MKKLLIALLVFPAVFFVLSLSLILIPPAAHTVIDGINQTKADINSLGVNYATFKARDGATLFYRYYPSSRPTDSVFILIHGITVDSAGMMATGEAVAEAGNAHVYLPDVRGHGHSGQPRGDADYIGQLEHDLSDLITVIREQRPDAKIIVGGHSAGGGLLIRYIGNTDDLAPVDGYLLVAPFMGADAPTAYPADPDAPHNPNARQIYIRRIVGLTMLNKVGITRFNHMPVFYDPIPVDNPYPSIRNRSYSFNLLMSFGPNNYLTDLARLDKPVTVWVGENDNIFNASKYPETFKPFGITAKILPGLDHDTIMLQQEFIDRVNRWLMSDF